MVFQTVVYVDKGLRTTEKFTEVMEKFLANIGEQGTEVVTAVPNVGVTETLGIWIFLRKRADGT